MKFKLYLISALILVFLFFSMGCQSNQLIFDETITSAKMKQRIKELEKEYPLLTSQYYEDYQYKESSETTIDTSKSLDASIYQKEYNKIDSEKIEPRIKRAIDYQKKGDIGKFSEIVNDIIAKYPLNEHSAQAAYLSGKFEEEIHNLDTAYKLYLYIVNVHYNTPFGYLALRQLANVLEAKNFYIESEKRLLQVLQDPRSEGIAKEVIEKLHSNLISRAIWFWKKNFYITCHYYLNFLAQLENSEIFQKNFPKKSSKKIKSKKK